MRCVSASIHRLAARTVFAEMILPAAIMLACAGDGGTNNVPSESIDGRWSGVASVLGAKAPLTLDLKTQGDSLLALVTMNMEALYVDRPLVNVRYRHPEVHFEFHDFRGNNGVFDGTRSGDTITGVTRKNANAVTMRFERITREIPPPAYRREVMQFTSRDGTRLEGTLFVPPVRFPVPAVVLIHGSGPGIRQDLFYLADRFAKAGIAAVAYDKRGSGASGGDGRRSTFPALAEDAQAAVESVRKLPGVDPKHVGLCGISEGGWITPVVAAGNADVAFVVAIVGPGTTYSSNALYQNGMRLRAAGASDGAVERYRTIATRVNEYARRLKRGSASVESPNEWVALQSALDSARRESWARVTDLPARLPSDADLSFPRWRMLDFDPVPYWKRVRVPALLVFAANDRNTNTTESRKSIATALAAGGNANVSEIVYPGVEHDLMIQPRPGAAFHFPYPPPGYPDSIVAWVSRASSARAAVR